MDSCRFPTIPNDFCAFFQPFFSPHCHDPSLQLPTSSSWRRHWRIRIRFYRSRHCDPGLTLSGLQECVREMNCFVFFLPLLFIFFFTKKLWYPSWGVLGLVRVERIDNGRDQGGVFQLVYTGRYVLSLGWTTGRAYSRGTSRWIMRGKEQGRRESCRVEGEGLWERLWSFSFAAKFCFAMLLVIYVLPALGSYLFL